MLQQKNLSDCSIGDELILFLIITKSEIKTARNGKPYANLELRDKSLTLPAKIWERLDEVRDSIKEGKIVKIAGQLEDYNGAHQIRIDKIRGIRESDNVEPDDFLPVSQRPPAEMLNELEQIIVSVSNPFLKNLLESILSGDRLKNYLRTPAGKGWHHAYLHGLLEHTLEIVRICDLLSSFHPEINRDLLVSGALLHDFGKTEELRYDSVFEYSDKGKLIGHIMIGAVEIEKAAGLIPEFPDDLKTHLIHLVLSHQGKLEFASPVEPKTLEAIVLYQADELSAKTNAYKCAIENDKNREGNWTRFLPLANTSLFIPRDHPDKPKN
jgi:3'-5' exoribonuclease